MESQDNSNNNMPDDDDYEKGKCYRIMRGGRQAMMLEISIPREHRSNAWLRKNIPYTSIEDCEYTAKGIEILTDTGMVIKIEGDNLNRLFDAVGDHKLRMVKPAQKDEAFKDGEPRPYKITITEPDEE